MNILAFKTLLDWLALAIASNLTNGVRLATPSLAAGVTVTSNAAAWNNTGAIVEIADNTDFTTDVLVETLVVDTVTGDSDFQVTLYTGEAGSEAAFCTVKFSGTDDRRIPINRRLPKATRISARIADSSAGALSANLSIETIAPNA